MHVDSTTALFYGQAMELATEAIAQISPEKFFTEHGDITEISEEALKAFKESALEPLKNNAYSLKSMDQRINVVRGEISSIWSSSLPDEEKYRQISSKEWEISLLQAGQFEFARSALSRKV